MGRCSRNKGRQDRHFKHEHSGPDGSWTPSPPATPVADCLQNVRISDLLETAVLPESKGQNASQDGASYSSSRWNSLRLGLRSKVLFPPSMQAFIDERTGAFCAEHRAQGRIAIWFCKQMAIESVKLDVAHELGLLNRARVFEKVDTLWVEERTAACERLAKRLPREPFEVAGELGRSKHGTLLLIARWRALGEVIASNRCLDQAQMDMTYDLMAIPLALRNGCRQVPAADDAVGLSALVERQVARHQARLDQTLNRRDELDRVSAQLGLVETYDRESRNLRSDTARAQRRLEWAEAAFWRIRRGADPANEIDPDTHQPINPDAGAPAASEPASPAPEPPPPPPATTEEPASESPARPLPEGCEGEDAEALRIAGTLLQALFAPRSRPEPPTAERGPGPGPGLSG